MRKRADKAYKRGFLFSYMHMGAVQGRVPVFVALYTCTSVYVHPKAQMVSAISHPASLLPPSSPIPVYASQHYRGYHPQGFCHSPLDRSEGNQAEPHQLAPPEMGASHCSTTGSQGERASTLCNFKKKTKPYTKAKPPHT